MRFFKIYDSVGTKNFLEFFVLIFVIFFQSKFLSLIFSFFLKSTLYCWICKMNISHHILLIFYFTMRIQFEWDFYSNDDCTLELTLYFSNTPFPSSTMVFFIQIAWGEMQHWVFNLFFIQYSYYRTVLYVHRMKILSAFRICMLFKAGDTNKVYRKVLVDFPHAHPKLIL